MELSEGELVEAPFFDGIGEVKKFQLKTGYILLELVLKKNMEFKTFRLTQDQMHLIKVVSEEFSFCDDSQDFFLLIEALRTRLAYQFDPLLAVNISQIDPWPHQIEGVYDYALRSPKVRFLIANDAGAGKTIMGGLIIKELQYRNMADRILLVVPGHLKYQWQREMKEKFSTSFVIVDRAVLDASWSENVWEERHQCISSIDFLKQKDIMTSIKTSQWDLILVDEAHKLSAYAYGDKLKKTKRYQAGEILSDITTHMLFLTATPHRGDEENFRLFLDLLRLGFFSKSELLLESIQRKENPLFVRRLKEDMRN
ncbi:MAG: DEAD/DEAH box helicase [Candidatus Ranarchaeia archaeon]|jgi:superfamily II DNA or RNA helicase